MSLNETIFEFFDSKYPKGFSVHGYSQSEGISAMVFDLKYDDNFVGRIIKYREMDKPYIVVGKELIDQINNWFGLSSYKCECLFEEWLRNNPNQKIFEL